MKKVAEVLDALREEEQRLSVELSGVRRAIAALEEAIGPAQAPERTDAVAPGESVLPPDSGVPAPMATPGPYAAFDFYEAVAAYLASAGEPRSAREIAEALQAGGYPTRAKDFVATVRTMLHRTFSARPFGIDATATGNRWFAGE